MSGSDNEADEGETPAEKLDDDVPEEGAAAAASGVLPDVSDDSDDGVRNDDRE